MKIQNISFLVLLVVFGCDSKKNENNLNTKVLEVVDVFEDQVIKEYGLDNFISRIDYLVLSDPQENTLISSVEDIRVFENFVFVHDKVSARILIYDKQNGELISKIQDHGPGPEEYSTISFFDLNEGDRSICIMDISIGKIFIFDFDGEFIQSLNARIICRDFAVDSKGNFLFYSPDEMNEFQNEILKPGLLLMNKSGEKIKNILALGSESYYPLLGSGESLIANEDDFYLISNYVDTIYRVKNEQVTDKIVINYDNKINEEVLYNPNFDFNKSEFPMLKLNPFISKKYLSYTFLHRGEPKGLFHDRKSESTTIYKLLNNKVNNTPFVLNGKISKDGNYYVGFVDELLIDAFKKVLTFERSTKANYQQINKIIKSYEEVQNPILVLASLK